MIRLRRRNISFGFSIGLALISITLGGVLHADKNNNPISATNAILISFPFPRITLYVGIKVD